MRTRKWFHLGSMIALIVSGLGLLAQGGIPAHAAGLGSATNETWVTETVQITTDATDMGARSLALDLYGHPHIAFGSNHLYYASNSGSGWQVEMVDPADGVGQYTSLALDAAGRPHISYFDNANGDLKYARYDGGAWRIERVDDDGWVGSFTSIDIDPAGRPQISYFDSDNQAVKIAWYDGTAWHNARLDSISGGWNSTALVLDGRGYPHVAYFNGGLKYTHVTDGVHWESEVIDSRPEVGGSISLALDSQGRPALTYCWLASWGYCQNLRYAHYDGSQWQIDSVNQDSWGGEFSSLALDAADHPHVSYLQGYSSVLLYAYHDGTTWHSQTTEMLAAYPSLALDAAGRPYISYYNLSEGTVRCAHVVPPTFADRAFEAVWQRTDQPITAGRVARSWMWGPRPLTTGMSEPYADSPGGSRLVQYYDKSRMEINNPNGDRSSQWFVTNGLLVREMVDGQVQLGDNSFERRSPSGEAVAGDPVAHNPNCPTYASFANLTWPRATSRLGQQVTATLARDGTVGDDPGRAGHAGTEIAHYEEVTGHNIPAVLWDFMNQQGTIFSGGRYRSGLVVDWLFAMGYPISEPYWTRCTVAGVEQDVLVQLFERRVLTYTPANPAGWQVEMGNVGRHYYTWRYGVEPQP